METPPLPPKPQSQSPDEQQQVIQIPPPDLTNLSTPQITKLLGSFNILKGYLATLVQKDVDNDVSELSEVIGQINHYIKQLDQLESMKQQTEVSLNELDSLSSKWQAKEQEMYESLRRFNRDEVYKLVLSGVNDAKKLCESIEASFVMGHQHDDQSIQQFIQSCQRERKLYYQRKEKLQKLQENRVSGL